MESNSFEDDLFKDTSKPQEKQKQKEQEPTTISPLPSAIPDYSSPAFQSTSCQAIQKPSGKLSKFGAVKVVKSVNFDEIEAKAKLEREAADRRGLSCKNSPITSPKSTSTSAVPLFSKQNQNQQSPPSSVTFPGAASGPKAPVISKEQQEAMDRLGMGMRKMNINQSVSSSGSASAASAKCKQQGISSETFSSSKNNTLNSEDSFVNDRLREIDTSKGISSDAFFGRSNQNSKSDNFDDEDDYFKNTNTTSPTNTNNSNSNSYSNLSNSAKELASKFAERASAIDIKGMKKSISSAGSRLSAYLQDFQNK